MSNYAFAHKRVSLGLSDIQVSPVCLGTMTFGEQVDLQNAHQIMDRSLEMGVNFMDTAEMYAVPPKAETFGATEEIMGKWFANNPAKRKEVVLATKVAGPSRGMPWIREGAGLTAADIENSCNGSLKRLQTDYIDLYQIHWPERYVPLFGEAYFHPDRERTKTAIHEQLEVLAKLVKAGKVRTIGLSNETPYGVHEFVRLAEAHDLPRIVSVQNLYCLLNRQHDNGLDETCHRLGVSLLPYSPLAFGLLTGKYDKGFSEGGDGRMTRFAAMQTQRWGRPEALAAAIRYNQLARDHGLTPVQLALAFCGQRWSVGSTIIGVTNADQLEEDVAAFDVTLSEDVLKAIDQIRWEIRDPIM